MDQTPPLPRTFTATQLSNASGDIIDEALQHPIGISRNRKVKVVMMSVERYRTLTEGLGARRSVAVSEIDGDTWTDIERALKTD